MALPHAPLSDTRRGALFAVAAYGMWGLAPIYFKWLDHVPAIEILLHRVIWSVLLLALFITVIRRWHVVRSIASDSRQLGWLAISGALVSVNWLIYVWALQNDRMVETSLGYYINPLFNVLLGYAFLGERFRLPQRIAIGLAAVGVLNEIANVGVFPWVGLSLAASFGLYGLVRKKVAVDSVVGLAIETALLAPLAIAGLVVWGVNGALEFGSGDLELDLALAASGVVTTLPLVAFAAAALRLPLSVLGLFQYIAPTTVLVLAVLVYGEPFRFSQAITFGCIWAGLVLFSVAGLYHERMRLRAFRAVGVAGK